jgi:hypothetical protein
MATRTTNFADDTATLLFRGVCTIMQEDPQLVAGGVNFRTWDGTQPDFPEPVPGQMPLIRLSPKLMPNEKQTSNMIICVMDVVIECFAAGLIADDVTNMWGAVLNSIVRAKPFRGSTVDCWLSQQAANAIYNPGGGNYLTITKGPQSTSFSDPKNPPLSYQQAVGALTIKWFRPG